MVATQKPALQRSSATDGDIAGQMEQERQAPERRSKEVYFPKESLFSGRERFSG